MTPGRREVSIETKYCTHNLNGRPDSPWCWLAVLHCSTLAPPGVGLQYRSVPPWLRLVLACSTVAFHPDSAWCWLAVPRRSTLTPPGVGLQYCIVPPGLRLVLVCSTAAFHPDSAWCLLAVPQRSTLTRAGTIH